MDDDRLVAPIRRSLTHWLSELVIVLDVRSIRHAASVVEAVSGRVVRATNAREIRSALLQLSSQFKRKLQRPEEQSRESCA